MQQNSRGRKVAFLRPCNRLPSASYFSELTKSGQDSGLQTPRSIEVQVSGELGVEYPQIALPGADHDK
jgi:hypothetical protein